MRKAEKNWVPFVVFIGVLFFTVAVIISTSLLWRPEPGERNETNPVFGHQHMIALKDFLWVNVTQENGSVSNISDHNVNGLKSSAEPIEKEAKSESDDGINQKMFENNFMAKIREMFSEVLREREKSSKVIQTTAKATTEELKVAEDMPAGKLSFDRLLSMILGDKNLQPAMVTKKK